MAFAWHEITWVLLDMDGTLLDKHFDDYFWETLCPRSTPCGRAGPGGRPGPVFARYKRQEGTLNWTDIDFCPRSWSWTSGLKGRHPSPHRGASGHRGFFKVFAGKRQAGGPGDQRPYQDPGLEDGIIRGAVRLFRCGGLLLRPGNPQGGSAFLEILQEQLGFAPEHVLWWTITPRPWPRPGPSESSTLIFKPNPAPGRRPSSHPDFFSIDSIYELME